MYELLSFSFVVFRIGKPLDHILLIDRIIKREKDDLSRNLLITKSIGFGGWLLLDSIQWVITLSYRTLCS